MRDRKVAVIGWDAATFDVIFPLLEAGVLPNLQRLMSCGAWGTLTSTLHPLSPTAWASCMTGMNPGKHGIFDFVGLEPGGGFRVMSGGAIRTETLWRQLSRAGRRVAVINVPMTYPPEPVNGLVIAGMDAPRQDRAFTYPADLADALRQRFGSYQVAVSPRASVWSSVSRFTPRYIEKLCDLAQRRAEVTHYLLERHEPDFLMVVFTAPDRAQHALGYLLASGVSPHDGIGQVYRACDNALGSILDRLGNDWSVLLMSDHGACAYERVFELGTWLRMKGWLRLRPKAKLAPLLESVDLVQRRFSRLMGRSTKPSPILEQFLHRVVWNETRAFALGAFGSIFVNRRGRFPGGIVQEGDEYEAVCQEITAELLSMCDPETGEPIVCQVHKASDVYRGPYAHLAPDLLVETTRKFFVRNNLDHFEGRLVFPAGRYHRRSLAHTGRHTPEGILVASGMPFAPGNNRKGAHIMDITPTVLYLSGLSLSSDLDGKPLLGWMDPDYCRAHPIRQAISMPEDAAERDELVYTEQEAASIQDRLRDLGYMG